jgi:hypothetical protein
VTPGGGELVAPPRDLRRGRDHLGRAFGRSPAIRPYGIWLWTTRSGAVRPDTGFFAASAAAPPGCRDGLGLDAGQYRGGDVHLRL